MDSLSLIRSKRQQHHVVGQQGLHAGSWTWNDSVTVLYLVSMFLCWMTCMLDGLSWLRHGNSMWQLLEIHMDTPSFVILSMIWIGSMHRLYV